jgi:N-acetylglucosaminyl-diphospho-decaprenol L-rhamnosyltransferase
MIELTIVIVTYNSEKDIRECLNSIQNTKGDLKTEIYVVDNASWDATAEIIRMDYPDVYLIANSGNEGFSSANNQGINCANGNFILLLNPDTVVLPGSLQKIISFMKANKQCGVCGPRLVDADGKCALDLHGPRFWHSLMCLLRMDGLLTKKIPPLEQEAVSGAAMLFRKSMVADVGLLDPELFWCEDYDFCMRIRNRGYTVCVVEDSHIIHYVGQSAKSNYYVAIRASYFTKLRYAHKHFSSVEFWSITCLYLMSSCLRWVKWSMQFISKRDSVSKEKAIACLSVVSSLFESIIKGNRGYILNINVTDNRIRTSERTKKQDRSVGQTK